MVKTRLSIIITFFFGEYTWKRCSARAPTIIAKSIKIAFMISRLKSYWSVQISYLTKQRFGTWIQNKWNKFDQLVRFAQPKLCFLLLFECCIGSWNF